MLPRVAEWSFASSISFCGSVINFDGTIFAPKSNRGQIKLALMNRRKLGWAPVPF